MRSFRKQLLAGIAKAKQSGDDEHKFEVIEPACSHLPAGKILQAMQSPVNDRQIGDAAAGAFSTLASRASRGRCSPGLVACRSSGNDCCDYGSPTASPSAANPGTPSSSRVARSSRSTRAGRCSGRSTLSRWRPLLDLPMEQP